MRTIRAVLTGFLLVLAFALSFGVLRHRAVEANIIHGALATVLWGGLSVHTQAGMWALGPDVLAAVGIVGVRIDRNDPRAWVALILGLGLTLTFQVWDAPSPVLLRAVPAVAGAMAVWMMEIPWTRTTARPDWPPPQPPTKQPEEPQQPQDALADAPVRTRRQRALTSAELVKVEPLIAERKAAYGIARELGIPYPVVRQHMRDQELVGSNGDRSES